MDTTNNKGDNRSSYLSPLLDAKYPCSDPLSIIEKLGEVTQVIIRLVNLIGKPKLINISSWNSHSIVS